jgi:hypothetical protein
VLPELPTASDSSRRACSRPGRNSFPGRTCPTVRPTPCGAAEPHRTSSEPFRPGLPPWGVVRAWIVGESGWLTLVPALHCCRFWSRTGRGRMRLAAACLAVLAWCVQPAHSAEQEDVVAETWMVQSVIDVQNVGAPDLYERARVWAVWAFRDSDTVLEIEEPGTLLMGKVTIAYNSRKIMGSATRWGHIRCVVKIDFQDARLRFTLTECTHEASPKNCWLQESVPRQRHARGCRCPENAGLGTTAGSLAR